jgi:hypothetical protein
MVAVPAISLEKNRRNFFVRSKAIKECNCPMTDSFLEDVVYEFFGK